MKTYKWELAQLFQSGMLFQREKEMILWGWSAPGAQIAASLIRGDAREDAAGQCSYARQSVGASDTCGIERVLIAQGHAAAGADGSFHLTLPPQKAGEGFSLVIASGLPDDEPIVLRHIGFGDIYLAGGQSNMEFFLKYDKDWEAVKRLPHNPHIRMYNVPQRAFEGHTSHNKTGYGYWFDDRSEALATFSAPAYSFARNLQEAAGVPIGVIGCNWGGSTAAAWVPKKALLTPPLTRYLEEYEEATSGLSPERIAEKSLAAWAFEDSEQHGADFEPLLYGRDRGWQLEYMQHHAGEPIVPMGPYHFCRPAGLYHTMLSELIPFALKGVLWYQGESDAGDRAPFYDKLLTALITSWREAWKEELPFLIVQLAPFGVWLDCDSKNYTTVREKQAYVAEHVTGVYIASIMDLGCYYDIHPKEKIEVGRRLALLARGHLYGEPILCDAPKAVSASLLEDGRIAVTFLHSDGLSISEKSSDLWITAGDLRIRPIGVAAENNRLLLTLPCDLPMQDISFVSLGWDDYAEIYIYNSSGLCAAPFRLPVKQEVTMRKKQAMNPFLPSWEYIPDGEPHVFEDRVYLYGSHDHFRGHVYCLGDYVCYSAPVDDLGNWRYEGVIYRKEQDPRNTDGKMVLFAPDVVQGPDGRYYLYYIPNRSHVVSVAVCDTPAGSYDFYGFVRHADGAILGEREGDAPQFDPGVYREGDAVYLYTGFCWADDDSTEGSTVTVLAPDMLTVIEEPKTIVPNACHAAGTSFEGHPFFEASSMRRRGDTYYFIYSSIHNHEMCYATAKSPLGPFTYQGVIVDNCDVGISSYKPAGLKTALHCNNHGSFTEINGRFYMFYHRPTNGTQFSRQACAEEIFFTPDGRIEQVEMTSCGLNGSPLVCGIFYDAYIACNLWNIRSELWDDEASRPMISQDGNDGDELPGYVCNMTDGATAGFKYFDCRGITMIDLKARGYMDGRFEVRTEPEDEPVAVIPVTECNDWEIFSAPCRIPDGVHALYLTYRGGRVPTLGGFRLYEADSGAKSF